MIFLSNVLMEMKKSGSDLATPKGDWGECQSLDAKSADNTTRDKFYETMTQVIIRHIMKIFKVAQVVRHLVKSCMV